MVKGIYKLHKILALLMLLLPTLVIVFVVQVRSRPRKEVSEVTSNQIKYQELVENRRANRNVERLRELELEEKRRAAQASEHLTAVRDENTRIHYLNSDSENARHNLAVESEGRRHNITSEQIDWNLGQDRLTSAEWQTALSHGENPAGWGVLASGRAGTVRSNDPNAGIGTPQQYENLQRVAYGDNGRHSTGVDLPVKQQGSAVLSGLGTAWDALRSTVYNRVINSNATTQRKARLAGYDVQYTSPKSAIIRRN